MTDKLKKLIEAVREQAAEEGTAMMMLVHNEDDKSVWGVKYGKKGALLAMLMEHLASDKQLQFLPVVVAGVTARRGGDVAKAYLRWADPAKLIAAVQMCTSILNGDVWTETGEEHKAEPAINLNVRSGGPKS